MTLNFTDFGLTSAIDPTDPTKVTADAQLRVSAMADSLGLIANYTQATNANKPLWSRADNRENLSKSSDDLSNTTYYVHNNITVLANQANDSDGNPTLDRLTANAGSATHSIFVQTAQDSIFVSGLNYTSTVQVFKGTNRYVQLIMAAARFGTTQYANFDLEDKSVSFQGAGLTGASIIEVSPDLFNLSISANATSTGLDDYFFLSFIPASDSARHASFNAAGTETVFAGRVHTRQSNTDTTYLPTTDHPQYAGVNGRRWLVLNGAQGMVNVDNFSKIYTTTEMLIYIPAVSLLGTGANGYLHSSNTNGVRPGVDIDSNVVRMRVHDGSNKTASAPAVTTGQPFIFRGRLTGGFLYAAVDTGAGFVEGSPVACGAASSLTETLVLSRAVVAFYGKLGGVFTANTGIAKPNFENLLREYYFARSQLIWDPYLAELVLKRPTVIG
jgi:hypothetical protein